MTGFDDVMFESLVDKIVVKNREEFEFNLVGSLKFTERMSNVLCNQKTQRIFIVFGDRNLKEYVVMFK